MARVVGAMWVAVAGEGIPECALHPLLVEDVEQFYHLVGLRLLVTHHILAQTWRVGCAVHDGPAQRAAIWRAAIGAAAELRHGHWPSVRGVVAQLLTVALAVARVAVMVNADDIEVA